MADRSNEIANHNTAMWNVSENCVWLGRTVHRNDLAKIALEKNLAHKNVITCSLIRSATMFVWLFFCRVPSNRIFVTKWAAKNTTMAQSQTKQKKTHTTSKNRPAAKAIYSIWLFIFFFSERKHITLPWFWFIFSDGNSVHTVHKFYNKFSRQFKTVLMSIVDGRLKWDAKPHV